MMLQEFKPSIVKRVVKCSEKVQKNLSLTEASDLMVKGYAYPSTISQDIAVNLSALCLVKDTK